MPLSNEPGYATGKYYPPSQEVLLHFAQAVGRELGEGFTNDEIVQGLADFMTVLARTLANDLNRKARTPFDKGTE